MNAAAVETAAAACWWLSLSSEVKRLLVVAFPMDDSSVGDAATAAKSVETYVPGWACLVAKCEIGSRKSVEFGAAPKWPVLRADGDSWVPNVGAAPSSGRKEGRLGIVP